MCPPDSVNSFVTPWALRRWAISRPPWSWVVGSACVLMAGRLFRRRRRDAGRVGPGATGVGLVVEALEQAERLGLVGARVRVPRLGAQLVVEVLADDVEDRLLG